MTLICDKSLSSMNLRSLKDEKNSIGISFKEYVNVLGLRVNDITLFIMVEL